MRGVINGREELLLLVTQPKKPPKGNETIYFFKKNKNKIQESKNHELQISRSMITAVLVDDNQGYSGIFLQRI